MTETGFVHSIKVHRIYKTASKIAREVKEEGKGVKNLVFEQKRMNIKALYAIVVETIQHGSQLDLLIRQTELLVKEPRLDPWLARVLMTELLWGKQKLQGQSKPEQTILSYQQKFQDILSTATDITTTNIKQVIKPRYVRVNTIMLSVEDAVEGFREEDWCLIQRPDGGYAEFLAAVYNLNCDEFMVDFHIPELLVFPPGTQFYKHPCYKDGRIVLQDKASCLPAYLLGPGSGSKVLDMCAAPGMKTTHLAAILNNEGTVYAVERDMRRFAVLQQLVASTNSSCVKTINRDVITLGDKECPDVDYILVDPSCSGSGIVDRVNLDDPDAKSNKTRLENLAGFQILILRHALTAFPKAKRVVYSTCSIFPEENEQVVKLVLASCNKFKLLCVKDLLHGQWLNVGSPEYEDVGSNCVYARPDQDLSNGFFVAVFERVAPADENDIIKRGKKRRNKNSGNYETEYNEDEFYEGNDFENYDAEYNEEGFDAEYNEEGVYPEYNEEGVDAEYNEGCADAEYNEESVDEYAAGLDVKNVDVEVGDSTERKLVKKKCKKSKTKNTIEHLEESLPEPDVIVNKKKKKSKKSKNNDVEDDATNIEENANIIKKKKKKSKNIDKEETV